MFHVILLRCMEKSCNIHIRFNWIISFAPFYAEIYTCCLSNDFQSLIHNSVNSSNGKYLIAPNIRSELNFNAQNKGFG